VPAVVRALPAAQPDSSGAGLLGIHVAEQQFESLSIGKFNVGATPLFSRTESALSFDFTAVTTQQILSPSAQEAAALYVSASESRRHGAGGDGAGQAQDGAPAAEESFGNVQWAVAAVATISMSWGFLRLAGLAASALASRPVWQHIDPIPLLNDDESSLDTPHGTRSEDESDEDEFAARDLLDQMHAPYGA
jgi:hypothetical protein